MADAVEERREPETVPPIAQRRSAAYTRRFVLAYVLVIAVFAGMVVLFAILVSR